jgi:hypothetical protein
VILLIRPIPGSFRASLAIARYRFRCSPPARPATDHIQHARDEGAIAAHARQEFQFLLASEVRVKEFCRVIASTWAVLVRGLSPSVATDPLR